MLEASLHSGREDAGGANATVKIGLVGLGYWGPNLLRVLADLVDVEVAWICDREVERLEKLGRLYPAVRRSTRFEDLLEDAAVDAVVIATPVFPHHALAMPALAA